MLWIHLTLALTFCLPDAIFSAPNPNLPRALARLGEARTRAITSRAKVRANTARFMNHVRNPSNPNRSKRQHLFNDDELADLPDNMMVLPVSLEEDEEDLPMFRNAEDDLVLSERSEMLLRKAMDRLRDRKQPKEAEVLQMEPPPEEEEFPQIPQNSTEVARDSEFDERLRAAEPHLHYNHFHNHFHQSGFLPTPLHPGIHSNLQPALNLNINQQQSAINQALPTNVAPVLPHFGPSIGTLPQSTIISQNQAIGRLREANQETLTEELVEMLREAEVNRIEGEIKNLNRNFPLGHHSNINPHVNHLPELQNQFPNHPMNTFVPGIDDNSVNHNQNPLFPPRNPQLRPNGFNANLEPQEPQDLLQNERESTFDPFNQQHDVMDFLSRHQVRNPFPLKPMELRKAEPTFSKKKKFIVVYPPQNYNRGPYFRQVEEPKLGEVQQSEQVQEANPTFKKLKKQKEVLYLYPQQSYGYGPYLRNSDADLNNEQNMREAEEMASFEEKQENFREANPTFHKLQKDKFIIVNPPGYGYGNLHFRAAEPGNEEFLTQNDAEMPDFEFARESSPTFHKNKKGGRFLQEQGQVVGERNEDGFTREAEEANPMEFGIEEESSREANPDFREAEPTFHKKKNKKFIIKEGVAREAGPSDGTLDFREASPTFQRLKTSSSPPNLLVGEPNIFSVPVKHSYDDWSSMRKRSSSKAITKRSLPLVRLATDPHVKLDVPQTMENLGTATRYAFEDERAPMYHLKNLVGSSRDAVLSAMRIPPQNLIIPSDYEIVKNSEDVGAINPSIDSRMGDGGDSTFRRMGEIVRDSIQSGQDTAVHINDIAHEARNILHSSRHSVPRIIFPMSKIPAVQDTRRSKLPSKAVLLAPRIVDIAEQRLGRKPQTRADFVQLSNLMHAVGLANPNSNKLDVEKIVFEPKKTPKLAQMYSKFKNNYDQEVGDAVNTLEDARVSVGAKNLRDFLVKMKDEFAVIFDPKAQARQRVKYLTRKQKENNEVGKFVDALFDKKSEKSAEDNTKLGMYLPPELSNPFMGQASDSQFHDFLRENEEEPIKSRSKTPANHIVGLSLDNHTLGEFLDYLKSKEKVELPSRSRGEDLKQEPDDRADLGSVLGAINPLMFERMYNQTVRVNNSTVANPQALFGRTPELRTSNSRLGNSHIEDAEVGSETGKSRTSMKLTNPMLRPFMGQVKPEAVNEFFEQNERPLNEDFLEFDDEV